MAETPVERAMEVCNAGGDRGANEVQCTCRMEIGTVRGQQGKPRFESEGRLT
jgi:hypothetical protein